jgi:hypothetical protein
MMARLSSIYVYACVCTCMYVHIHIGYLEQLLYEGIIMARRSPIYVYACVCMCMYVHIHIQTHAYLEQLYEGDDDGTPVVLTASCKIIGNRATDFNGFLYQFTTNNDGTRVVPTAILIIIECHYRFSTVFQ